MYYMFDVEEQDKSYDIEQQSPFGDCKRSNTLPQMKGGGVAQNQREHPNILIKYATVHPTAVSENYSLSGMLRILIKNETVYILSNTISLKLANSHILYLKGPNHIFPKKKKLFYT